MDPGVYLRWEDDMKQWLRVKNIPKEDKLSYALDMLIGKAYTWWKQEDAQTYYSNPVLNWRDLKARMYKEFVRKLSQQQNSYKAYVPRKSVEFNVNTKAKTSC